MSEKDWTGVSGKRVLVTGATNGIGLAAARELARRGARLTLVARSEMRAGAAVDAIREAAAGAEVEVLLADLESQASVRHLAARVLEMHPKLDVLVNNAGAVFGRREVTVEGFERTWALNHLGPFLLTNLLLQRLVDSAPSRIVTTSSDAHKPARMTLDDLQAERSYGQMGFARYSETKLANILFTRELARRLAGTGVTANCFHPGIVATGFNRNNGTLMRVGMTVIRPFARSVEKGAETLVWLVDSPDVSGISGGYFTDMKRVEPSRAALDDESARRLWEVSEEQTRASGRASG